MFFISLIKQFIMEKNSNNNKFPGYPHYPANEDITRAENNNGQLHSTDYNSGPIIGSDVAVDADIMLGTEADVTEEERLLLEAGDQNVSTPDDVNLLFATLDSTDSDGDPLNEPDGALRDFTGSSLDVPGSELDDDAEDIGEEDEENNYYSLGGDNHEDLEENKGS